MSIVGRVASICAALALTTQTACAEPTLSLRVAGNRLLGPEGRLIQLRGVNFSGAQYECLGDRSTWDVPADQHTIAVIRSWRVNAVRIPLNEDCWLGINGLPFGRGAESYRRDIAVFVSALHHAGIYVLLNLHVAAPGRRQSRTEAPMADRSHGPAFWRSVAHRFRSDPGVIFDLYNEPKRITWSCWQTGCGRYAGMTTLIRALRSTGARQPVVADGLDYGNDLSAWLAHRPFDPLGGLMAGFHTYGELGCSDPHCWDSVLERVAARVPVVTGEVGEFDCAHHYLDRFLPWADAHSISYLAWAWNSSDCAHEPSLLAPDGTPSPYGSGYRDHLLGQSG